MNTADVAFIATDGLGLIAAGWDLARRRKTPGNGPAQPVPAVTQPLPAVAPHPPGAPVTVLPPPSERPDAHSPGEVTAAFASALKALRAAANLTTRDLGATAGLSNSTVTSAESGKSVTLETAAALARALGVTVDEMVARGGLEAAG